MVMKAFAADGTQHNFEDGTAPGVIDRVMKNYAINQGTIETPSGPIHDSFWANHPFGRILDAFGQGAKDNWGAMTGPSEVAAKWVTDKTEEALRNAGILSAHKEQQESFVKSINEALWRPSAAALRDFMMAVPEAAGTIGAATGAVTGGLGQAAKEFGFPKVGEAIRGAPEVLPGLIGVPTAPPIIRQARRLKVIGEGEGGFTGTERPPLELTQPTEGPAQGRLQFPGFRTQVTDEPTGTTVPPTPEDITVPRQEPTAVSEPTAPTEPVPTKSYLTTDGKIDLKQLETPQDVETALGQTSRGPSDIEPSSQMVSDLADALGLPAEDIIGRN